MGVILAFHEHALVRDRLRRAAAMAAAGGARHDLRFAQTWTCVADGLRTIRSGAVVVDALWKGRLATDEIAALLDVGSRHAFIVYSDFAGRPASDVLRLSRLGIEHVLTVDVDDHPSQICHTLARAIGGTAMADVEAGLADRVPADARRIVAAAKSLAHEGSSGVDDLADALRISRKELERRCSALKLPTPKRLLRWCRFLLAAPMLADPGCTVAHVAASLGFSDARTMRRTFEGLTGRRLEDFATPGRLDHALDAALGALAGSEAGLAA